MKPCVSAMGAADDAGSSLERGAPSQEHPCRSTLKGTNAAAGCALQSPMHSLALICQPNLRSLNTCSTTFVKFLEDYL